MAHSSIVTISHNEVIVACRKAFEALGLSFGQAEDASEAIGWLALHRLPFQDQLSAALNGWQSKLLHASPLSQSPDQSIWDAQGGSALYIFPNLIDYGSVQAQKNGAYTLQILNMPDVGLMWPYIVCIQKRGISLMLQRSDGAAGVQQIICQAGEERPAINQLDAAGDWLIEKVEVRFLPQDESSANHSEIRIANSESLLSTALDCTANGIQIEASLWIKLNLLGKGLLVESTAESENRGAGGV